MSRNGKGSGPSLTSVLLAATCLFGGFCGGMTYVVDAATAKPKPFVPPSPRVIIHDRAVPLRPGNAAQPLPGGATNLPVPVGTALAANGATVQWSAFGAGVQSIQLTGTWNATVQFEGSNDGTVWDLVKVMNNATDAVVTSATANGTFILPGGRLLYRLRISAFTSGSLVPLVFVDDGSNIVRVLNSAGGGGGGAMTVADGADVAQGTTTDAGITTDIAGTLVGFARGNIKQWNTYLGRFPAALTGGGNLKVALAESTASQAVTGTLTGNQGAQGTAGAAGSWFMQGAGAGGAAAAGNPVLIAGSDATNARTLLTDTSGRAMVVGAAAAGTAIAGNPVLVGVSDGTNVQTLKQPPVSTAGTAATGFVGSAVMLANGSTLNAWITSNALGDAGALSGVPAILPYGYNGATVDKIRNANVYKTVSLGAGTAETTIWTPTSGKKFRLMGFHLTTGAASTLTFKDNTGGTTVFISRGTTDQPQDFAPSQSNGILSAAANNVLTVTRGTSATLDGELWGTEE